MRIIVLLATVLVVGTACQASNTDSSCTSILVVDGAVYIPDESNSGRLSLTDLDPATSTVDDERACETSAADHRSAQTWAIGLAVGTEVHPLRGYSRVDVLATVTAEQEVVIYRSENEDRLSTVRQVGANAINIDSELGGLATLATITDDRIINTLIEAADSAPTIATEGSSTGKRYFIEFEHGTLVTVVPFWIETQRLGNRLVGSEWSNQVSSALAK